MPRKHPFIKQHHFTFLISHPITVMQEAQKFFADVCFVNLKNYFFRRKFRARVNVLIRPWLIISAICLFGIGVALLRVIYGKGGL